MTQTKKLPETAIETAIETREQTERVWFGYVYVTRGTESSSAETRLLFKTEDDGTIGLYNTRGYRDASASQVKAAAQALSPEAAEHGWTVPGS